MSHSDEEVANAKVLIEREEKAVIYLRTETDKFGNAVDYHWYCSSWCYRESLDKIPMTEPGPDDRVLDGLEEGGAYPCGAEHDSPDYCAQCETPVGNPLTEEGVTYMREFLTVYRGFPWDDLRAAYPYL